MVISYLKNIETEFLERKSCMEKNINQLQTSIRENEEFIKVLEESSDSNYELFTPREVNVKNKKKLQEVREEHCRLSESLKSGMAEYEEVTRKLNELTAVIESAISMEEKVKEASEEKTETISEENSNEVSEEMPSVSVKGLSHILHKIDFCSKILDVDSNRCKIELQMVYRDMQKMVSDLEQKMCDKEDVGCQ